MSLDMLWLCGFFITASFWITASSQGPIIQVQAVVKESAFLPCDITPPIKNDSVILVIWYKNGETAVYSFDSRSKTTQRTGHWKDAKLMEGRAYFRTVTEPATLSLDEIVEEDEGLYRCRVDFKKSPTRNTKVQLTVIVPPGKPKIFNDKGKELISLSGPHEEGSPLKLKCIVSGGKPRPSVIWWRGEALVDSSDSDTAYPDVKDNQLTISRLNRSDLGAVYTCQASNNNISQPLSASVSVEVHFKPLSASILSGRQPLSVDRKYEIVCQSVESRPPAKISWWKGNKRLDTSVEEISSDGNLTTSTLTFTPSLADDGKTLTCRAENSHVRAGFEEDSWKLIIHYAPMLKLELGAKLNPEDIEEGDDVYFKCRIKANPPAYKVMWKHDGRNIMHNPKTGIILGNADMALQGVRRQQAGNYSCMASNVEGDTESNVVQLKIMFKPSCKPEQKRVYGVARHEDAKVICEVDSYPPPDSFRWSFNNTAETIEVPQSRYSSGEKRSSSLSILTYKPVSEMDYGSVMCWATNYAGPQKEPCVFHIVAAGKPDPPYNCTLSNQTAISLEVECLEGFDGGLSQMFILEVFDLQTNVLEANLSALSRCSFLVTDLMPGKLLRIRIFATNGKGRSDSVYLEGFTLNTAEKQTGMPSNFELTPVLGAVLLLSVIILIVTLVGVALLRARTTHSRVPITRPSDLALVKDKTNVPLRSNVQNLYDDKNPDVIPCNKDSDYQLVNGSNGDVGSKQSTLSNKCNFNGSGNITPNKQTDLYDSFKKMPPLEIQNKDVTYAELSLPKSNSQENNGLNCIRNKDELTIYAQIDHSNWAMPYSDKSSPPLLFSPSSVTTLPSLHREIVTVRTPLMANQQESCV